MCAARGHAAASDGCWQQWGVRPRAGWPAAHFGDKKRSLQSASNIVLSNGLLDPWSAGGVLANVSESVIAVVIPSGAHLPCAPTAPTAPTAHVTSCQRRARPCACCARHLP